MKLSYSALKNYLTCPYKYYLSQFFKSLPSPKFEGGRKVHEVISKFYEDLIRKRTIEERAIYPTITRYAQEVLGEEFLNYILVFKNFERFELWRRRVMMLTPIAVEEVFESNEFIGVPDVVFVCNDGKKCVIDWKTFSIPKDANIQAYFYQKLTGADYIIFF
ncbi:MAG: PD-(D/E)XK nuclease family protein, partial [Candidatus Thorarchaeota archaeon]